jgi:hypothetical protein
LKVCLGDTLWATSPSAQSPVGPSPSGLRARDVTYMENMMIKDESLKNERYRDIDY